MNHVINVSTNFTHNILHCDLCIGYSLQTAFVLMDHLPIAYRNDYRNDIIKMVLTSVDVSCVHVHCEMSDGVACEFNMRNTPEDGKGDNWYLEKDIDWLLAEYRGHCAAKQSKRTPRQTI